MQVLLYMCVDRRIPKCGHDGQKIIVCFGLVWSRAFGGFRCGQLCVYSYTVCFSSFLHFISLFQSCPVCYASSFPSFLPSSLPPSFPPSCPSALVYSFFCMRVRMLCVCCVCMCANVCVCGGGTFCRERVAGGMLEVGSELGALWSWYMRGFAAFHKKNGRLFHHSNFRSFPLQLSSSKLENQQEVIFAHLKVYFIALERKLVFSQPPRTWLSFIHVNGK